MTHTYQLFCWLFNDHWLILYPMKHLDAISSSTQSSAQGWEQRDSWIHVLKWLWGMHGTGRYLFYLRRHTLSYECLKTALHFRVLTHKHSCYACISLWLLLCVVYRTADSFVHSPVFTSCTAEKPSAEFPESRAYFGAAERLYTWKYFMLCKASKLYFWRAG